MKAILAALFVAGVAVTAAHGQSQMELNNQAREEREKADQKLNKVYAGLMARLTTDAKAKLRRAQITWISFRDQECEFEAMKTVGGSIHGMIVAICQTRLTEQRAGDLERLLVDCKEEGNLSCPPMAN
jgi:uncharacterized protein YecT (DUF1311 family)